MKNYILLLLLFQGAVSFSQYYTDDNFFYVNKPDLDEVLDFYKNEFELNPADLAITLAEVEKNAKSNQNPSLIYFINKQANNLTQVTVRVNNLLFSESFYKNGLLHGKKTMYNGRGVVFHEIDFEKGKANGLYKMYSDYNELYLETHFKNNLKDGKRILYNRKRKSGRVEGIYQKGILVSDLTLINEYEKFVLPKNLKKGKVKQYSIDGLLVSEYNLGGNGVLHGLAIVYNISNGLPYSKVPYNYGKKNGIAEFYNKKGELLTKNEFRDNNKIGKHQSFFDNYQIKLEENFDNSGKPIGVWTLYYNDGRINNQKTYKQDGSSQSINYSWAGAITAISDYDANSLDFNHVQYFEKDILKGESYKANGKTTMAINYYDSGEIYSKEYLKGEFYEREYYDKSGKVYHINKVNDQGKRIGIHRNANIYNDQVTHYDVTYYDDLGNKTKHIHQSASGDSFETNFKNDKMHGAKITRNAAKQITKEEYYYDSSGKLELLSKEEFLKREKAARN